MNSKNYKGYTADSFVSSDKLAKKLFDKRWENIVNIINTKAELVVDEDTFSYFFKVKIGFLLTLDEIIKLQSLGYGVFKTQREIESFNYEGYKILIDNPTKYIIMWQPKKEN